MRNSSSTAVLMLALSACGDTGSDDTTGGAETTSSATTSMTSPAESSSGPSTTASADSSSSTEPMESSSGTADETSSESTLGESSSETAPVEFALSSPAFVEGAGIPGIHHVSGGNISPELNWVGAPDGTQSFAVFFHDITIDFEHSAIWDIAADATGLPEDVDHTPMPADVPGALQCRAWTGDFGYGGPGSPANFYEFTVFALDVASVDEIDTNSELIDVRVALEAHAIATATLSGQSTGPG